MPDAASEKIVLSRLIVTKSKRRIWVLLVVSCVFLLLGSVAWVRATWSPSLPEPTRASEGVVCGDHELTDGTQPMKCTFVVDKPLSIVQSVMMDYGHFYRNIPYVYTIFPLSTTKFVAQLIGVVHLTPFDAWAFTVKVTYRYGLSHLTIDWEAEGNRFYKNKGSCVLRWVDTGRTEVSCFIDLDLRYVPWIAEKNIVLTVWPQMMAALKTWVESIKEKHPS